MTKATIEHLDSVYDLICELEGEQFDKNEFLQIYKNNINNKNIYYLLATDKTNVLGFASLHIQKLLHHCGSVGEIQELVVSAKHRHLGVGTTLFNNLKKIAINNDCVLLEVCCNKARKESLAFYHSVGMSNSHYKFTYPLIPVHS